MMRNVFITLFVLLIGVFAFSNGMDLLNKMIESSRELRTLSCFIHMKDVEKKSEVAFKFAYKREGGKMRLDYVYPKGMSGSRIAVDGEYCYMYLSTFKKTVKKKIENEKKNIPGSEMGIFFYYVVSDVKKISSYGVQLVGEDTLSMKWEDKKYESKVYHVIFENGKEKEEVWIDAKYLIPVKIRTYYDGKPKLEMDIFDINLNESIPDEFFRLE